MVIFNSYVNLPEGKPNPNTIKLQTWVFPLSLPSSPKYFLGGSTAPKNMFVNGDHSSQVGKIRFFKTLETT